MDEEQKMTTLLSKIHTRLAYDAKWARTDFIIAQVFIWLAILSSFSTAILTVADVVPKLVLALLAAIPGAVILVDKSFSFARRARWHYDMVAKLDQFSNQLQFEGARVEDVSKQLGQFRVDMEARFPAMSAEGLGDKPARRADNRS